jgi:membrane protease YdiL (CAAX protease family)
MRLIKKYFPSTVLQSIGTLFVSILLTAPFYGIMFKYLKIISDEVQNTISFILMMLIFIAITCLINKRRGADSKLNFNLKQPRLLTLMIPALIGLQIGIEIPMSKLLTYHFTLDYSLQQTTSLTFLLGAVILAPLLEEIVFRGIILRGYLLTYSPKTAVFLASLLFAIAHGTPIHMLSIFLTGLFLCWIYYKTKALTFTIILHAIFNVTAISCTYIVSRLNVDNKVSLLNLYGPGTPFIIGFCIVISLYTFYLLTQRMAGPPPAGQLAT